MSTESLFVSTTIPYVNSTPHVGFALELAQADTFIRDRKNRGIRVFAQTGADENSLKNVLAARARSLNVQEHVDAHTALFQDLSLSLGTAFDRFVRTSSVEHRRAVEKFWGRLCRDDLYRATYSGHYCVGCEDFLNTDDLRNGLCPDHGTAPDWIEEENIFFRLSRYQEKLRELIASDRLRITPATRKKEILNFLTAGLRDISITRDRRRSGDWGIPVPGDDGLVVYVWIDALINYISGGGWEINERRIHFVGKNVWKFHALYWPALLLSAGLPLPDEIVIHGFLTLDGRKISKSSGATVDPLDLIKKYGADSVRFYLLRAFAPFEDGDFSERVLRETHNTFLVNGLGNLLSRLTTLADRFGVDRSSLELEPRSLPEVDAAIAACRFDEALKSLWREVDRINTEITAEKPWESLHADRAPGQERVAAWLAEIWSLNHWLGPFLPSASAEIARQILSTDQRRKHLFERLSAP